MVMSLRRFWTRRKRMYFFSWGRSCNKCGSFILTAAIVYFISSTVFQFVVIEPDSIEPKLKTKEVSLPPETHHEKKVYDLVFYTELNLTGNTKDVNISSCSNFDDSNKREKAKFRVCQAQYKNLEGIWKTNRMYAMQGVDGSKCCLFKYIGQVEEVCPFRQWFDSYKYLPSNSTVHREEATMRLDLDPLLHMLEDPGPRKVFAFVRMRVKRNWDSWVKAAKSLAVSQNMTGRDKKKILLYPGMMTNRSKVNFVENQFQGAPLGEIVQWTDLISVLYVLGHDLTIATEYEHLLQRGQGRVPLHTLCPATPVGFDLFYTDIIGLHHIKPLMGKAYESIKCMLRLLDSFGTEAPYNDKQFAEANHLKCYWGQNNIRLQQFYTLYPHTPDNSFLGFVVERHGDEESLKKLHPKENIALIYAKDIKMWKQVTPILDALKSHVTVHATVNAKKPTSLPNHVINHGVLPGDKLHDLLKKTKIFVGFPTSPKEGPGPLEALGYGAVFINPIFNPPFKHKLKPMNRKITSINPYTELNIGEPRVYTVDMSNTRIITDTVKRILELNRFEPYMSYEFSHEGMLQRINAYIKHQNYCNKEKLEIWPPADVVTFDLADTGESCKDFCWKRGKVCEPAHFGEVNTRERLDQLANCTSVTTQGDTFVHPSMDNASKKCTLQDNVWLFSCTGQEASIRRFCPCRTFLKGQVALCPGCE